MLTKHRLRNGKLRTMSRADHWTHVRSKLLVKRKYSICGTWRCTGTPSKQRHGREQDATKLASSESIPTKVAPKLHVTTRVLVCTEVRRQPLRWKLYESYSVLCARKTFFELKTSLLISIADVSRARFCAVAVRDEYVRLPDEDPKAKQPDVCVGNCERRCTDPCSPTVKRALRSCLRDWRIFPRAWHHSAIFSTKTWRPTFWCTAMIFS